MFTLYQELNAKTSCPFFLSGVGVIKANMILHYFYQKENSLFYFIFNKRWYSLNKFYTSLKEKKKSKQVLR